MTTLFDPILNEAERESVRTFLAGHGECQATIRPCAGFTFGYTLRLTPTNIAMHAEIECTICHVKKDVSDYDSW